MTSQGKVPAAATLGLLAAWALHDLEELATMPGWTSRARPRLHARLPWVPERVWARMDVSPAHARAAIALMGVAVAAASVAGARTNGRSGFYQRSLVAFGWHSVGHVAMSLATRGYTPGVVTAPLVVAPFSLWAWRALAAAGVPRDAGGRVWQGFGVLALALGGTHGAASLLTAMAARATRAPSGERAR